MFDPVRICEVLNEEGVEYVIVGGFAAVIRGSSLPTRDIDIVPSRAAANGLRVLVASLDDVIDSKRAANRPKDQLALPYLESLRDQSS